MPRHRACPGGRNDWSANPATPTCTFDLFLPPAAALAPDLTPPALPTAAIDATGTVVTGTGEAGATLTVTDAGGAVIGTTTVLANGSYAVVLNPAQIDGQALTVTQTDGAGNPSPGAGVTAPDLTAPLAPAGIVSLDGTTLSITIPASITVDSAVPTAGTCSAGGGAVTCDLGSIPGGSSRRIDMSVRGSQNGSFTAAVTLAASNDSNVQNNALNVSLNIGQVPTPAPGSGDDGGGGGALGGSVLLGLLAAALRRLGVKASANHRQQVLGVDL